MSALTTLSQNSCQIAIIGQLAGIRRYFPKSSADTVPSLGLAQQFSLCIGKSITLQFVYYIHRLHEKTFIVFAFTVSLVRSDIQDVIKGSITRRLSYYQVIKFLIHQTMIEWASIFLSHQSCHHQGQKQSKCKS